MRVVGIDEFQQASGGVAFAVGDRVTWRVLAPDPSEIEWKTNIFGPEAGDITDFEEHHNLIHLTDELTGTVRTIRRAIWEVAETDDGTDGTVSPVRGSGRLIPSSSTAKDDLPIGSELAGFVVEIDE